MKNSNSRQTDTHVDELIEEVEDNPSLNSHERHFLRSRRGRRQGSGRKEEVSKDRLDATPEGCKNRAKLLSAHQADHKLGWPGGPRVAANYAYAGFDSQSQLLGCPWRWV